jgi:radical SAM superfamily enzyme YgiQ (UPF0313 family)
MTSTISFFPASDPTQIPPELPPVAPASLAPRTVLFVMPFYPKDMRGSLGKHVLTPPLTFSALAAVTPASWSMRYWDENLLQGPPPRDPIPQVVAITVHLTFARRAYELGLWFRAHGSVVVMGGLHALSCPDEVAQHCDTMAVGNGVPLWPRILADIEHGCLLPRYDAEFERFAAEPAPDRSIIPRASFLTTASLIATRGCHNRCDFCYLATSGRLRMRYQMRPPADVAAELAALDEPYGVFLDNNLGASRPYLRRLCQALAPVGKIWSAAISLDVTCEPDLVAEMAAAGCTGVFVGFESLSDENIQQAGKRCPPAEDWGRRVALFHQHGIQVNGSFVLGFDHDRPDVFVRPADWIEANRLECATFHIMTPYPGTPLYARLWAEGRILHQNWDLYDTAHAVFRPRHMAPQALEAGYAWLYRRVFSLRSIWTRRPERASAVLPYLASSLLYKKANPLWRFLIHHRLTHKVWRPLVATSSRSQRQRATTIPPDAAERVRLEVA